MKKTDEELRRIAKKSASRICRKLGWGYKSAAWYYLVGAKTEYLKGL